VAVLGVTALLATACASSAPPAGPVATGYREEGLASWYGEPYHGRQTASGPRYDMNEMTAAHRTLPFGTLARVTNLENGKRATVLVNDRGPFVDGRIIDLSRAAAEALDSIVPGVVRVRVEVERLGDGMLSSPCWEVQVGAFAVRDNAERAQTVLERRRFSVRLAPAGGGLTRVRVTGIGGRDQALAAARRLAADYPGAVAVPCGAWS
jgi:rare lipoprotein A